jgi:hypothetical protein
MGLLEVQEFHLELFVGCGQVAYGLAGGSQLLPEGGLG